MKSYLGDRFEQRSRWCLWGQTDSLKGGREGSDAHFEKAECPLAAWERRPKPGRWRAVKTAEPFSEMSPSCKRCSHAPVRKRRSWGRKMGRGQSGCGRGVYWHETACILLERCWTESQIL